MKMNLSNLKRGVLVSTGAILVLASCAGRQANPVKEIQANDASMSCAQIATEVQANNKAIEGLVEENQRTLAKNMAAGAGGLIFFPALFFMDLKGAAGDEARAYQRRNEGLLARHQAMKCQPPIKVKTFEMPKTADAANGDAS